MAVAAGVDVVLGVGVAVGAGVGVAVGVGVDVPGGGGVSSAAPLHATRTLAAVSAAARRRESGNELNRIGGLAPPPRRGYTPPLMGSRSPSSRTPSEAQRR